MSVNPLHSLGMGIAMANDADARTLAATKRAIQAETEALRASAQRARTEASLQEERDLALVKIRTLEKAVREKNAALLEWMHSTEAFRQLARQFGKKLNMTDEQRTLAYQEQLINVAEDDPRFSSTNILKNAVEQIRKTSP